MNTKILSIAALVAAFGTTAAPALAKELRSYGLKPPATPVQGLTSAAAQPQSTLIFPTNWRKISLKAGVLVLREGGRSCEYTVRASTTVAAGSEADAAARAAALTPASGPRVLESGARNSAAWRVTRPAASRQIRIVAVRAELLRSASQQAGTQLWLQTTVTAVSGVGDECHSGTYRDTVGPSIGDALATARTRAFVRTS